MIWLEVCGGMETNRVGVVPLRPDLEARNLIVDANRKLGESFLFDHRTPSASWSPNPPHPRM
jgi:hypothetical protein